MMPSATARRRGTRLATLLAVVAILGAGFGAYRWINQPQPVEWDVRGFNMPTWSVDGFRDSGPALEQLRAAGGNTVTLVVTWYVPHPDSTEIRRTFATASDESLIWAMDHAREIGLRVIIKPMVDVEDRSWRANISPTDPDAWFASYDEMMLHYAEIAAAHDVWGLIIGNELVSMSTNPVYEPQWRDLIAGVRERFDGKLTYGANWGGSDAIEEWTHVPFWDALDYIGIAAYFELSDDDTANVAALRTRWNQWKDTEIAPFQQRWNKPVMFTEIGYRSLRGAASEPWNADRQGEADTATQTAAYQATFEAWHDVPWFAGTLFWNWNPNGAVNPADTGYEVQNKPALDMLAAYYGGDAAALHALTAVKVYQPQSDTVAADRSTVEVFATGAVSVTYTIGSAAPVAMSRDGNSGLWRAPLETGALANGTYNIVVLAYGKTGTATDHAWNIAIGGTSDTVAQATTPAPSTPDAPTPTSASAPMLAIRIANPQSDQSYNGVIAVRAEAPGAVEVSYRTEAGAAVAMTFDEATEQWQAMLDTTQLPNGKHQVIVTARDSAGTLVSDQAWNIDVTNS